MNHDKIKAKDELNKKWREGYDFGMKNALQQNSIEIEIGRAIINALDRRYEFKEEDY